MRMRCLGIGILVALLVSAGPASAATVNVTATSNVFTPKDVAVNVGDTVNWTNGGGVHNVHFDDGSFDMPATPASPPWTVSNTFGTVGTYRYYCEVHGGPNGVGMSGTVAVNVGYPRPKGATPLYASLAPAYKPCTTPNRTHGPALSSPSCNPPAQVSDWLTVGTPDAHAGTAANSVGSVRLGVIPGDPGTPAVDDADVQVVSSVTDVRKKSDLTDYTGQLQARLPLRVTDKFNGPSSGEPATGDTTFTVTIPCTATGDTTIGSTCAITTSADAVVAGMVLETKRSIWGIGKVEVFDGGSDGLASTTAGNTLFADQAVFIP
jgi:plastocyanin